jgi:uncharacterized protein (TIGR02391 family)
MARRAAPAETGIPPTLTPQRAIELLRKQIEGLNTIYDLPRYGPEEKKWSATTEAVIIGAFGRPNDISAKFLYTSGSLLMNQSDAYYAAQHRKSLDAKRAILESAIEQLEILAPPVAQVAEGQYRFHAEIERVSGNLFRDGHYKSAASEAYIRVIEEVKRRSGLNLDGDDLMNQSFGCANRTPVLRFNPLSTEAERDEQKGFMFLFKGVVGLRNFKAHSNVLFNDPLRAHDYLSLASLLMRMLELTQSNPVPLS